MSNNEIFEYIFDNVSNKIINQYLTKLNVVKDSDNYRYSGNISVSIIISSLNDNLFKISDYLVKEMQISDKRSIAKILKEHINSSYFKRSIKKIEATIESRKKLDLEEIRKTYAEHLKYFIMTKEVKAKIFALAKDTTFKGWIERRNDNKDKRIKNLFLSKKIKPLIMDMRDMANSTRKKALSGLSNKEQTMLRHSLKKIKQTLSENNI